MAEIIANGLARRTLVALVENKPGALMRVAGLLTARGYNIESLAVGHAETPGRSRMTFVVDGATTDTEQVVKFLKERGATEWEIR